jgi:tetratricopeptide (TPR) repeat protein
VCALAGCGGSNGGGRAKSHASFDELIGAGQHLLDRGNDLAAARAFQQAIAKKPTSPVGYYDLGVVYGREGQRRASLTQYARALHADKNYVPALYNYGVGFVHYQPPLAIYFFRRVLALQPDSPTALLNLGLLLSAGPRGQAHALRLMKRAVLLQPSLYASIPSGLRAVVRQTKLPRRSLTGKGSS